MSNADGIGENKAVIAPMVEHWIEDPESVGSSPTHCANCSEV